MLDEERERRTFIQHAERNQRAMSCHDYLWILGCCCWHIIILTSLQSSQSDLKKMHLYFCSSVIRVSSEYCPSMVQVVQVFVPAIWKGGSSLSSLYCPRILWSKYGLSSECHPSVILVQCHPNVIQVGIIQASSECNPMDILVSSKCIFYF